MDKSGHLESLTLSSGMDGPFSYQSAVRGLLHQVRTADAKQKFGDGQTPQPAQPNPDDGGKNANSGVDYFRKLELMQRLQEGPGSGAQQQTRVFKALELEKVLSLQQAGVQALRRGEDDEEENGVGFGDEYDEEIQRRVKGSRRRKKEKPFEVIIPLGNERMKLSDIRKTLKNEYAARYLEQLGVAPTSQNLSVIHKFMPLEKCKITQVFHPGLSKAERRNYISIQPSYNRPRRLHVDEASVLLPFEQLPEEPPKQATEPPKQSSATAHKGHDKATFDQYKDTFVFPYNLNTKFEPTSRTSKPTPTSTSRAPSKPPTSSKAGSGKPGEVPSRKPTPQAATPSYNISAKGELLTDPLAQQAQSRATTRQLKVHDVLRAKIQQMSAFDGPVDDEAKLSDFAPNDVQEEHIAELERLLAFTYEDATESLPVPSDRGATPPLPKPEVKPAASVLDPAAARELNTTPDTEEDDIKNLMSSFIQGFPFSQFWTHDTDPVVLQHVLGAKHFLNGPDVRRLAHRLFQFLACAYLDPLRDKTAKMSLTAKDNLFVELYNDVLSIVRAKTSKHHTSIDLPLLILSLRVLIAVETSSKLPLFCATPHGKATLLKMDCLALTLIDPMGLLSHLSAVESTPQALRVLHKKRLPPRLSSTLTSPIVQFIVGETLSKEAKALVKPHPIINEGLAELRRHLTPMVRSKLLHIVATKKMQ